MPSPRRTSLVLAITLTVIALIPPALLGLLLIPREPPPDTDVYTPAGTGPFFVFAFIVGLVAIVTIPLLVASGGLLLAWRQDAVAGRGRRVALAAAIVLFTAAAAPLVLTAAIFLITR